MSLASEVLGSNEQISGTFSLPLCYQQIQQLGGWWGSSVMYVKKKAPHIRSNTHSNSSLPWQLFEWDTLLPLRSWHNAVFSNHQSNYTSWHKLSQCFCCIQNSVFPLFRMIDWQMLLNSCCIAPCSSCFSTVFVQELVQTPTYIIYFIVRNWYLLGWQGQYKSELLLRGYLNQNCPVFWTFHFMLPLIIIN